MKSNNLLIKVKDITNYHQVINNAIEKTSNKRERSYQRSLNELLINEYKTKEPEDTIKFIHCQDRRYKLYGKIIHKLAEWSSTKQVGQKIIMIYVPTAFIELDPIDNGYKAKLSVYDMTKSMER